ncbi:MAG TPA: hypothetical protein VHQ22_17500, partial [Terriglobales bacterium]|nr:hypothetical protein [Terriglobales bacterium]
PCWKCVTSAFLWNRFVNHLDPRPRRRASLQNRRLSFQNHPSLSAKIRLDPNAIIDAVQVTHGSNFATQLYQCPQSQVSVPRLEYSPCSRRARMGMHSPCPG